MIRGKFPYLPFFFFLRVDWIKFRQQRFRSTWAAVSAPTPELMSAHPRLRNDSVLPASLMDRTAVLPLASGLTACEQLASCFCLPPPAFLYTPLALGHRFPPHPENCLANWASSGSSMVLSRRLVLYHLI